MKQGFISAKMAAVFIVMIAAGSVLIAMNTLPQPPYKNIDPKSYGPNCRIESTCGNIVGVDCGSAADGPYYYVDKDSGETISRCGGYCMDGTCTNCPPKEWTCPTY